MFDHNHNLILTDFGISQEAVNVLDVTGTFQYSSPVLYKGGKKFTKRDDMISAVYTGIYLDGELLWEHTDDMDVANDEKFEFNAAVISIFI